jgi:hypothetical protein
MLKSRCRRSWRCNTRVYQLIPPKQQNNITIAVDSKYVEANGWFAGCSFFMLFSRMWIWSTFMVEKMLVFSWSCNSSLMWLRWGRLVRGSSNTAAFLLNDRLDGKGTRWGVLNVVSIFSICPSKLAGKIQSSDRAAHPGGNFKYSNSW